MTPLTGLDSISVEVLYDFECCKGTHSMCTLLISVQRTFRIHFHCCAIAKKKKWHGGHEPNQVSWITSRSADINSPELAWWLSTSAQTCEMSYSYIYMSYRYIIWNFRCSDSDTIGSMCGVVCAWGCNTAVQDVQPSQITCNSALSIYMQTVMSLQNCIMLKWIVLSPTLVSSSETYEQVRHLVSRALHPGYPRCGAGGASRWSALGSSLAVVRVSRSRSTGFHLSVRTLVLLHCSRARFKVPHPGSADESSRELHLGCSSKVHVLGIRGWVQDRSKRGAVPEMCTRSFQGAESVGLFQQNRLYTTGSTVLHSI